MGATWELSEMYQAFLQAPVYHLALEALLLLMVLWLLFHKSYKFQRAELTEQEKEQLIKEWVPEPLVPDTTGIHYSSNPKTVVGKLGKYVEIDGKRCLNFATHNYLGLVEEPKLQEVALKCLRNYGVGSCGPRGFYGTVDIHLELEKRIAEFMNVEEAVLYSYGFSTISSAIPAYAKQGDVIFCDEGVNFAIQKGLQASRSKIYFFEHNNLEALERLLLEQDEQDKANPVKAKVTRRFLVVEGLYINYGDLCPLPHLIKLKKQFKVRLFIDESHSFGVLGYTGRGITEHYDIDIGEVDFISSTLEAAIPAYGGFCCGTSFIVDHQRLSGLGYCFSASLPPLQAGVAISALDLLEKNADWVFQLRGNCVKIHKAIKERIPKLIVSGDEISPVKHLRLSPDLSRSAATTTLESIVEYAMDEGIALTVARYLDEEEHKLPPPSIRLTVTKLLVQDDIDLLISVLDRAVTKALAV